MFGRKNVSGGPQYRYDPSEKVPAVKSSICTGERVAGFFYLRTRKFQDVMLIRKEKELEQFCRDCGVSKEDLKKIV